MAVPIRDQGWGNQATQAIDAYNAALGYNQQQPMQGYGQPARQSSYGGGNSMFDQMASALMGNQLGSYLNFGNNLQGGMDRMLMVNLMNQRAQQNNNALNSQLGQTQATANGVIQAALANALGNVGSAYQSRQGIMDQLNHPLYQQSVLGNSGVNVENARNSGALDRMRLLPGILSGLGGMFNMGGSGGGLMGFSNPNTGQSAQMGGGNATQMAMQAAQPLPQQAEQRAVGSPSINPALAGMAQGRSPGQGSRDYLRQYMGMG